MKEKMRNSGIDIIGGVPWGTHLCQFYRTKQDLLDILVPYFKAGLENNEFCMWVTSESLKVEDARAALEKEVKDLDEYFKRGQLEILDYREWYTRSGKFDAPGVLQGWVEKEKQAIERGFDGLRLTGNTFWLEKKDWQDFANYEAEVNSVIGKYNMLAICTYSLDKCKASEILEVVENHQFALIRHEGKWEVIESSESGQVDLLQKAYDELEIRIAERTAELIRANTDLRGEIAESKKTEVALKQSERDYRGLFESAHDAIIIFNPDGEIILDANQRACEIYGFDRSEFIGMSLVKISKDPDRGKKHINKTLDKGFYHHFETVQYRKDGSEMYLEINASAIEYKGQRAILSINRDITDRKQAEEALRASEQRYRLLFERNFAAVYRTTLEGTILDCNESFAQLLGYASPQELMKHNASEFYFDDKDRQEFLAFLQKKGYLSNSEICLRRKDGTPVWILENISLIKEDENSSPVIQGTSVDITERKRAEEALRESEERFRTIFESVPISMIMIDKDGIMVEVSPYQVYQTAKGLTPREGYIGKSLITHPTIVNAGLSDTYRGLLKGKFFDLKDVYFPSIQRGTEGYYFNIKGVPLFKEGEVIGAITVHEDITERKKAEEALRESEKKYKDLFENAREAIVTVDLDGRITNVNKLVEEYGFKREELFGKRLFDFVPEYDKTRSVSDFDTLIGGNPVKGEMDVITPKGISTVEYRDNPILRAGKVIGIQIILTDITERKKAEESLRDSEEKYRSLFEGSLHPITIYDRNATIVMLNKVGAENLKKPLTEILGKPLGEFIPETHGLTVKRVRQVLETGKPLFVEDEISLPQGKRWFLSTLHPVLNPRGQPDLVQVISYDITERKRAEEALRESERKYRNLIEDSLDGICIVQGVEIKFVNQSLLKMFNCQSENEMVGHQFTQFVIPEYRKTMEEMGSARERGENIPQRYEFKGLRKDGTEFNAEISVSRIPYQGNVARQGIIRDITERKKAEEKLREANTIINRSPAVAFTWKNQEGWPVEFVSENVEKLFGYTAEEFMSGKIFYADCVHPDELERVAGEVVAFSSEEGRREFVHEPYRIKTKDGLEKVLNDWTFIVRDENGQITHYKGVVQDITERKKAEEEIRKLSQYLESIIDNANVWLDVLDEKANIMIWNKASEQISGYSKEEVIGHDKIWGWLYPDEEYRNEITTKAAAIIEKEEAVEDFETIIRCKNGEIKTISWNSRNLLSAEGKPMGSIALGRDVTERKKLIQQLIQSEKLAAVGTLAYGIAHEFNNILAGMLSSAEFGASTSDPELIKESFDIIAENTKRASSITRNLLAFARQKDAKKEITNITQSLKSVLALTRRELEKANIKIVEEFKPIPELFCDPGHFSEVFLNLITNAWDAMLPQGGTLNIKLDTQNDNIRIIFKDTGCGIPDEIKSRVFEPFVTTKGALGGSEIPGTGLGLFLTYGIINSYQGKIEVESRVGKGTQFTILIPISKNLPPAGFVEKEPESLEEIQRRLNILLVDDEVVLCKILKKFLETKGHQVTASSKAREGLRLHHKDKYDVIISDITMPDMDGIELIKKIKEKDKKTRIIVMTGHVLRSKEKEARDAGADEVLIKPFENKLLYQTISRLVSE